MFGHLEILGYATKQYESNYLEQAPELRNRSKAYAMPRAVLGRCRYWTVSFAVADVSSPESTFRAYPVAVNVPAVEDVTLSLRDLVAPADSERLQ
jgi:hypothetical protein